MEGGQVSRRLEQAGLTGPVETGDHRCPLGIEFDRSRDQIAEVGYGQGDEVHGTSGGPTGSGDAHRHQQVTEVGLFGGPDRGGFGGIHRLE